MDLLVGIGNALAFENLIYAFVGCFLGTLVGVLPGLGPVSAMAILFPFVGVLPPTALIIVLVSIYFGCQYGGSTTAILMNVPGELSSVATAVDGYQMTRQGRAGPALAMAAIVSFIAGILGCIATALLGPSLARVALEFGPAEYLGLGLFSLTAVSGLAGKSILRGILMSLAGMILAMVGYDMSGNISRMTFGSMEMTYGFSLVPVMIGLFGVAEMLRLLEESKNGSARPSPIGSLMPSMQELKSGIAAGLRATVLAFPLGLLPGMGPGPSAFLAYSFEKQRSKTPERFGKGAIEGVAAPEAANNAAAMGHIVPLLALGIPTSASMALILAALTIYGLVPGPLMFTQHAEFTWTIIGSFFVGNVILLVLNLPLVGLWARIATIPMPIMAPLVLVVCAVGSYTVRHSMFDVWVTAVFGIIGWLLSRSGWPMPPLILAFILGPMIELSSRQVWQIEGPALLLHRPIFLGFVVAGLAILVLFGRRMWKAAAKAGVSEEAAD